MVDAQHGRWRRAWAVYADPRMAILVGLGFSSGLPLLLVFSTLSAWLKEAGISKTQIGLFALVRIAYSFKFVWSPMVDRAQLPVLGALLGQRRSWMLLAQAGLIGAILGMAATDPASRPLVTAGWACLVAFASATQDIAIDAYRVELLAKEEQGAGAATLVMGYRFGMLASGAGALYLAEWYGGHGWSQAYQIMAALMLVGAATVLLAPRSAGGADVVQAGERETWLAWVQRAVIAPFADFERRPGWLAILVFIILFKFGDALAGTMANPFYLEMGFTKPQIASVAKVFGLGATIVGGLMGGLLVARYGIVKTMLACGAVHVAANLMSVVQALHGNDLHLLMVTISLENLSGGMSTTAFVAYLSSLCNIAYTATQYALLTSLATFGRDLLASGSGWLADTLGWVGFFLLTTAIMVPPLVLFVWMTRAFPQPEQAIPVRESPPAS